MSNNTFGLILDTSQNFTFFLLANRKIPLGLKKISKEENFKLEEFLKDFLKKYDLSFQDLAYLGLGNGPGSYTGLRLGFSCFQGLKLALKIPLVTFCSLETFVPREKGKFTILAPAYGDNLYLLEGESTENLVVIKTPILIKKSDCNEKLPLEPKEINSFYLSQLCFEKFQKKSLPEKIFYL